MTLPLIPDESLAELRAISEANLPHTAEIIGVGDSTREPGGIYVNEPEVKATFPCRLMPAGAPTEQLAAGQPASTMRWLLVLPAGTVIQPSQQVRVSGETKSTEGSVPWVRELEVIGPITPHSYETQTRVLCESRSITTAPEA